VSHPEQLENYIKFCQYRHQVSDFQRINFEDATDLDTTTLLPLYDFILDNPKIRYVPPSNRKLANYVSQIFEKI
jgi:hypothetical protein